MKTFLKFALVVALCAGGTNLRAEVELVDQLQAVVTDTPITSQRVEILTKHDREMFEQQYPNQPEKVYSMMIKDVEAALSVLVNRNVILQDFKESIKVPDAIIDDIVQDQLKKEHPDTVALTKQLEIEGMTLDQLKQEIRAKFIVEQMRLKFVPEPIISPKKVEDYYVAHRNDFKLEDQIKMRMIFLSKNSADTAEAVHSRANEILSQVKSGSSFEELAKTYSEGSLKSEGGETGWEDLSVVNPALVAALNGVKPGQTTGVVETPEGFYILLLEDRHTAHYKPLTEVRAQIERNLAGEETERLSKQWIERLKKKTFIKYF